MMVLHLSASTALAQTFDGSGVSTPPDGVSLRDPSFGWGGQYPGAPVVELTGWAAQEPLVERVTDGPRTFDRAVVDDLFGTTLGATLPATQRLALAARLPIWLGSGGSAEGGVAPGDLVLSAPIRVLPGDGPRLLLVPSLRAPTGAGARYLGDPGFGGSLVASAAVQAGLFGAALDLGLGATAATGVPDWPGGLGALWAADVSLAPGETVALHAELAGRAPLGRTLPGVPSEVSGSVRLRPTERAAFTAGAGTGLVRGVGAAAIRLQVGARVSFGSRAAEAPPVAPPASATLRVVDERGWPVTGAVVTGGSQRAETDADGDAQLPARVARAGRLDVTADGFLPASVATVEGDTAWSVTLTRRPVPLTVSVVGPAGPLDGVFVDVESAAAETLDEHGPIEVDAAGLHHVDLPAGVWTLHLGAPGMGAQQRTIVIDPSRAEPIRVDAVLAPEQDPAVLLAVKVVDGYGQPVEDAVVAIGERDLGTTGTGGDVVVAGLAAGEVAVVVRSSRISERTVVPATLVAGRNEVVATLDWPAGAVLVRVTDTSGRPLDAGVTFSGAARLPERATGSDGEELFVLRPGTWTFTATADAFAPQTRTIEVRERRGELVRMDVALLKAEGGRSSLELAVRDVDGGYVPGAQLLVDGQPIGITGTDGVVVLGGLTPGQRFLEVRGQLLVPLRSEVEVVAERQREELVVWYTTGVVDVEVRGPEERPLDARVAFDGPSAVPSAQTGPDGALRTVLPPGTWRVATAHPAYGLREDEVVVIADERRRHLLDLRLAPVAEETATLDLVVVDPQGRSLEAAVAIDGVSTGSTPGGRVRLEGLTPGPAALDVTAEGHVAVHQELTLDDVQALSVTLPWAPGALEVAVSGPDGPVEGALVALAGPAAVPSRQTSGGAALFSAHPGTWWVLASHPDFAIAEQQVVLPDAQTLTHVDLTLAAVEPDDSQLVVSVRDESGAPVADAVVRIDGQEVGRTSQGGTFALVDRPQGKAEVTITPGAGFDGVALPVTLRKGEQDRNTVVVPWTPTPVEVAVANGTPGTRLVVYGDDRVPTEVRVEADGTADLSLRPGTYTVVAEEQGKVGSTVLVVRPGGPTSARVELFETGTTVTGGLVRLTQPILFDVAQSVLRPDAGPILDDVARRLVVDRTAALVEIQGHTSDEGGVAYNQQLSEARARTIREALVTRGVEPERLVSRGYGLSRPLSPARDEEGRAQNRRVELVILDYIDLSPRAPAAPEPPAPAPPVPAPEPAPPTP
jgi:outer membrane protein OmpA-like peptidoglycan-associated protein